MINKKVWLMLWVLLIPVSLGLTDPVILPALTEGEMALFPRSATVLQGESFDVSLKAKVSSTARATSVKAKITYDPAELSVVSAQSQLPVEWTFPAIPINTATSGVITLQQSGFGPSIPLLNGEFVVMTIRFKAASTFQGPATIIVSPIVATDTKILTGSTNHITRVSSSTITVQSPPGLECVGGEILCAGSCVNGQNDRNNCGQCGTVCQTTEACVRGVCQIVGCENGAIPPDCQVCPAGQDLIRGKCTPLLTEMKNALEDSTKVKTGVLTTIAASLKSFLSLIGGFI